jgi:hypothetical protein
LVNVSIFALGTFCSQLMNEMLQVVIHLEERGDPKEPVGSVEREKMIRWLRLWKEIANEFGWKHVEDSIRRLEVRTLKGIRYKELDYGLHAINDALMEALKFQLVYQYPAEEAATLKRWQADWEDALKVFPAASSDIFAATDLWALGHYTASVFHSMRVLECGIGAMADELAVDATTQNWQNVIEQIESAVRQEQRTLPKGSARQERLQFLSEAAKELMYFKDGWRNYVSHNKRTYTGPEARSVLEHVRQFTIILARRSDTLARGERE